MLEIFWSDKSEKSRFFSIIFYFSVFLQPLCYVTIICVTASFQRFVILLFSVLVQTKQLTKHTDKVQSSDFVVYRLFCVAVLPFT